MSLYIGHLSSRTRRDELERVFQRFGRCNVKLKDGYGFVVYDYPPNAQKALRALQGRNICGEPLTLTWSNKQPRPFKKFARADRSHDHEPLKVRSRGGDYGNRKLDLNVQQDYKMSIEQPDRHGVRLNSADLLNAGIDYHQDHFKEYTREDNHDYGEDLLNEGGEVEPNLMDGDRWDGQRHDLSNDNDVEHETEFDRYIGYDRKYDNESHQIVSSYRSPAAQSPQEEIARELIGEGTMNHPKDSKAHQACYSCGALGHKKHNCPRKNTSRRYFSRFDRRHDNDFSKGGRGQGVLASFGSKSRAKLWQDEDPLRTKRFKDTRKASGSGKHGRLIENGSSPIAKETDRAWEKDYGGNKRSRRRGGTPKTHRAKKAKPISSPHHPDYSGSRSRSKSGSLKHMPRSISWSRSSRAHSSSTNLRSSSYYSRSRSSKSSSRSSSPTSLSLSVSLGRPLPSSPNKGQLNLKDTLDKSNIPESKETMVGGEPAEDNVKLENAKLENGVAPVNVENAGSSVKVENEVEKDQAMQRGNIGNHMTPRSVPHVKNPSNPLSERGALAAGSLSPESLREIKGSQDFDALTTEDVIVPPVKTDSELTSGRSTSISSEELCMVMKHYVLEPPDENERHLSAESYFGSARLWPWEIVYYRRLKKGPISTENYARRVAQNKEFDIVDKYIRSSSGWGELNHP